MSRNTPPASSSDLQFHDIEIDFGAVDFPIEFRWKFRGSKPLLVHVRIKRWHRESK